MIKVLIAEDEYIIREGIKSLIDWEKLGFLIIGEAEDGEEAFDMIKRLQPDIVITDVQMPFMNGIELQKKIKENNIDCYTVVVSGYDDFSYAQALLNNGAFSYLLKPLEAKDLEKVLTDIKEDYSFRIKNKAALGELHKYMQRGKKYSIEHCAYLYLNGISSFTEAVDKLNMIGIDANELFFVVMKFHIYDDGDIQNRVKEVYKKCASPQMAIWQEGRDGSYMIVAWNGDRDGLRTDIDRFCNIFTKAIGRKVYYTDYKIVHGLEDIRKSCQLARNEFARHENQRTQRDFAEPNKRDDEVRLDKELIAFCEEMAFDGCDGIAADLDNLKRIIRKHPVNDNEMRFLLSSIIYRVFKLLNASDIDWKVFLFQSPGEIVSEIMNQSQHKRIERLKEELFAIRRGIDQFQSNRGSNISKKAKRYIEEHYTEDDLSLCDVAHYVNMSVSYFSVVFKKEEGESFSEYLTKVRLDKAKELLLLSNYRSYEIAIMVGYANATYFSTMFKKKFGVSPTDFRKARQSIKENQRNE